VKQNYLNTLLVFFASLLLSGSVLAASYRVSPLTINFGQEEPGYAGPDNSRTLTIKNEDARPLYLSLDVKKVINPGRKDEAFVSQSDMDPKKFGLVLNNTKLIIPPGQERTLVVMSLMDSAQLDQDATYRIVTTPMQSSRFLSEATEGVASGVAMVLQYGIHVFVPPENPDDSVRFAQNGSRVSLSHTGNSFNSVSNVYYCPLSTDVSNITREYQHNNLDTIRDQFKCQRTAGAGFLHVGQELTYDIPEGKKLVLIMYNHGKRKARGFVS